MSSLKEAKPLIVPKYERTIREYRNLEGKILTIIDASVIDKRQNEAMKSLICQVLFKSKFQLLDLLELRVSGQTS